MKVYIGPYKPWIGPYQIASWLRYLGVSSEKHSAIGKRLNGTRLAGFCEWVYSKRKRTVRVNIHDYDVWSLDHTLALITAPALRVLKEKKQGVPCTLDSTDVPEGLTIPKYDEDSDEHYQVKQAQWYWILDEMIWAFDTIADEETDIYDEGISDRVQKGLMLYAKYYRNLWD